MTDEYLKQIGRVAVNFSSLEIYLTFSIWELISEDQDLGKAITSGMSFNSLSNMFAAICKIKINGSKELNECEEVTKRINEVNVRRNQIMHSNWLTDEGTSKVSRLKIKADGYKGIKLTNEYISVEEIQKLADEIKLLAKDVMELSIKYKK
ncbi:MAG: hypothetical protein Q8L90_05390 [Bacteroidota bacterium]|nr:hypothetical protein [Bacteroidota bacterium]